MKKILSILFLTLVSASLIVTARALDDLQYSPVEDIETTAAEDPVELPYSYPASGTEGSIIIGKVIGQTLGWGDNPQSGAAAAFDGDPHTFFDPMGVGDGFCGIEAETDYILDKVAILSREDWSERFAGAMIQGSRSARSAMRCSNQPSGKHSLRITRRRRGS